MNTVVEVRDRATLFLSPDGWRLVGAVEEPSGRRYLTLGQGDGGTRVLDVYVLARRLGVRWIEGEMVA